MNGSTTGCDSEYFGRGKLSDGNVMSLVLERVHRRDLRHPERCSEQLMKYFLIRPTFLFLSSAIEIRLLIIRLFFFFSNFFSFY